MKKLIFAVFCLVVSIPGAALATEISWMHVQHRAYGGGQELNRLGFGLIDDRGNYITDGRKVKAVKLLDPNKKEVEISELMFDSVVELFGTYDAKNSQWYYSKNWQYDSWFYAEIAQPLNPGLYWLEVTMADGNALERTFAFNQRTVLPVIDSNSIRLESDPLGNLVWTWQIPVELGQLAANHRTRARASIDIYEKKKNTGYFSIILPAHLGYVFIPAEVVQMISQKGDRFEVKVQLETRDKNNRTYSNPVVIHNRLPGLAE